MAQQKITRVPILPLGLVNAHIISADNRCVVVDTGLPGSERKIGKALAKLGMKFSDIKLIIITHAHVDHAGSAARLRELSGAPILAHAGDAKHYSREVPMTFCPTGWFGRFFIKTRLMLEPYTGFVPDIHVDSDSPLDLAPYGISGVVRHTPGHTSGSISVLLNSREALVGDLIASGILLGGIVRTSVAKSPPFEDDPRAVALALHRMVDDGVEAFYMGHGGPLHASEVCRHANRLADVTAAR